MAKTAKSFDSSILTDAISEVEQNGPLASLSDLYEAVAVVYNKNRGKNSPVNKSFVTTKIKSLKLNHKTKAGKRGRSKGSAPTESSKDDILTPLTEWETKTVEAGKYQGTETRFRHTIRFDSRQWILARETESAIVGLKYSVSFRLILPCIEINFPELKIRECIPAIVNALSARIDQIDPMTYKDGDDLKTIGADIDQAFNASFYKNEDLRTHLRKGVPAEEIVAV